MAGASSPACRALPRKVDHHHRGPRQRVTPWPGTILHHDAFQCGYCTPGQIRSAVALIKERHAGSDAEIRGWMSGNICRCGAHPKVVAAIRDMSRED